jgi:hypothetical protein
LQRLSRALYLCEGGFDAGLFLAEDCVQPLYLVPEQLELLVEVSPFVIDLVPFLLQLFVPLLDLFDKFLILLSQHSQPLFGRLGCTVEIGQFSIETIDQLMVMMFIFCKLILSLPGDLCAGLKHFGLEGLSHALNFSDPFFLKGVFAFDSLNEVLLEQLYLLFELAILFAELSTESRQVLVVVKHFVQRLDGLLVLAVCLLQLFLIRCDLTLVAHQLLPVISNLTACVLSPSQLLTQLFYLYLNHIYPYVLLYDELL